MALNGRLDGTNGVLSTLDVPLPNAYASRRAPTSHPLPVALPVIDPLLQLVPPWLVVVPLVGVINAALFFVIIGRRPASLPLYLIVATTVATAVQALGLAQAGDPPLSIGDVNLVATSVGAWASLVMMRSVGL